MFTSDYDDILAHEAALEAAHVHKWQRRSYDGLVATYRCDCGQSATRFE